MISTQQPDLFDMLVAAGHEMRHALEQRDLDGFTVALDTRTRLIEELKATESPSQVRSDWRDVAAIIAEQDGHILKVSRQIQEEIAAQIAQTAHLGHAARQYGGSEKPGRLIQGSVIG